MKTIQVKKLWFGDETRKQPKVTLRSYQVNVNASVKVEYEGASMVLTPDQLKNPVGKRFFKSKIGSQDYYLWDYLWKPDDEELVKLGKDIYRMGELSDSMREKITKEIDEVQNKR